MVLSTMQYIIVLSYMGRNRLWATQQFRDCSKGINFQITGEDTDPGGSLTPLKVASLHTTYIQQIKELHSLKELGVI